MHRLFLLGMNHSTAPLALREALAFNADQQRQALAAFVQNFPGCEAVLLSTCNRVELYVAGPPHQPGAAELTEFLAQLRGLSRESFEPHLYHFSERHAVLHLFGVASSLDSMVLGEGQILGQVRDAYDLAHGAQSTGPLLNSLFQRAIAAGKQVMSQTALGEGRTSVAAIAVEYAKRIFEDFSDKVVLSIGAGKMSTLMLQNLAALSPGKLLVCNRDPAKAQALAERFGAQAVGFDALSDHLVAADIVLSCTGSTQPIITRKHVEKLLKPRRYRPLFIIDIALPRDVEASVAQIEHVYLYDLEHLQRVVAATQSNRQDAVAAAQGIVDKCVDEFLRWRRKQEVGPLIDSWFARYHKLAQEEVQRTLHKLPNVTPGEQAHLEKLARRIVNKLLHDPIQQLQQTDTHHVPATAYLHALEKLFKLEEEPESEVPPEQSKGGGES
jgi:glutamyl-tRNA reductase